MSRFETTRELFCDRVVILNGGQMTRTTPDLAPSSQNFRTKPAGGHLTHVRFNVHQGHKYGGSSVESDFKPSALRLLPARGYYKSGVVVWAIFPMTVRTCFWKVWCMDR
ncbi:hypothetical protein AVEN_127346-1 [Araneus ventricosus]|uniref:Alpha-carbonic anhydrase domain-containing protein n=1 Tax=Araneus ventricosus TaxID=182803 RepID=A0A4Y2HZL1_ARAVE|nr:hypothetical protein AVEN_127346-1 [Araneus ventricosus]